MRHRYLGAQRARLRDPNQGQEELTQRQHEVLAALKAGMTEREAAKELGVSPHTVHSHAKAVYLRYGVSSRGQLLSLWISRGQGRHGKP